MNQILEYGTEKSGKSPKSKVGSSTSDKIVRVFAIILIIFAIALIGSGVYSLVNNKKTQESSTIQAPQVVKASITAEADEDEKLVLISVKSDIEITKLIYNWNAGTDKVIDGDNKKEMNKTIDLSSGKNKLIIKVIDKEGNETTESFEFESENGVDVTKPDITLELTEDNKLLITATDDTELAYITYMWNEEEQITVEATDEGQKKIVKELEIPKGKNTITVIAVDASEKSNNTSETQTFFGTTKPEINYALSADSSKLEFVCTHEDGIKSIKYVFNGNNYEAVFEDDDISDYVQFVQDSDEGTNNISLTVTSVDGVEATFNGTWEYFPATTQVNSSSNDETDDNITDVERENASEIENVDDLEESDIEDNIESEDN